MLVYASSRTLGVLRHIVGRRSSKHSSALLSQGGRKSFSSFSALRPSALGERGSETPSCSKTTAVVATAALLLASAWTNDTVAARCDTEKPTMEELDNEWDDFMLKSIRPGEDDDDDEDDDEDEEEEEEEEEEEGGGGVAEGDEEEPEKESSPPSSSPLLTFELLSQQNAQTSNAIIEYFSDSSDFAALAKFEGDLCLARDNEDASKLQAGVDLAKEKGVIDPTFVPEPYIDIDVLGKTPDQVADEILGYVGENKGSVIVLCGLSGTGKGTTVAKLIQKLEGEGDKVVSWSNGNIFRSVTLLAATWCEQQEDCDGFNAEKALTKENLASFMDMLEFGKFNGKFDTSIKGLGLDMLVSQVQNTELKSPKVAKNIPTVAKVTQGEVILFAADAIKTMGDDGLFVLVEGREQTVNYIRTPNRFVLMLSDETLIGKRRAAQRIMAAALEEVKEGSTADELKASLEGQLSSMLEETKKH